MSSNIQRRDPVNSPAKRAVEQLMNIQPQQAISARNTVQEILHGNIPSIKEAVIQPSFYHTSGTVLFVNKETSREHPGVRFKIKIKCDEEELACKRANESKSQIIGLINTILKQNTQSEIKELNITYGSIDFDGFAEDMGSYFNLAKFFEDMLNIITDIKNALCNFIDYILHDEPITKETEDTALAGIVVTVGAAILMAAGAPFVVVAAGGAILYKYIKDAFK